MAQWDTAYVDELPDSSFLWIEDGGHADGEGKTVPRSKRHFPVRDKVGKLDADHLRNALAQIPKSTLDDKAKAGARTHGERLLEGLKRRTDAWESSVQRMDVGELRNVERTPQGGIRARAYLTRVGVFPYRQPDGSTRRELRLPEEVFSDDSVSSIRSAPVTVLHPKDASGKPVRITTDNYRQHAVGVVEPGAEPEGMFLAADVVVQDAAAVQAIEDRQLCEISLGYTCDFEPAAGTFNGEPFDGIQRNIFNNHAALGPQGWGRAGREVGLRVDGGDMAIKVRVDGLDYEEGTPAHLQALERRDSQRVEAIATTTRERDAAIKERDDARAGEKKQKERADALDKSVPEKAAARATLLRNVERAYTSRSRKFDDALAATTPDDDLIVQALKLMRPDLKTEGWDPMMVRGAFMAEIAELSAGGAEEPTVEPASAGMDGGVDAYGGAGGKGPPPHRTDGGQNLRSDGDASRDRMLERNQRAYLDEDAAGAEA